MTALNSTQSPPSRSALSVVIIGGSLAGLIHGLMLKRLGHNVHILEQNLTSTLSDSAAGITTGLLGREYFQDYDRHPQEYSFVSPGIQFLDENSNTKRLLDVPMYFSSWNVLYYRLRANFDSFQSQFCSSPPEILDSDGDAKYDLGKRVTGVSEMKSHVSVDFEDLKAGGYGSVHADLVLVADGQNSSIRRQLIPNLEYPYSGYVAWRGTIKEEQVSESCVRAIGERFTVFMMPDGYLVGYIVPGPSGSTKLGERLINYAWYQNCPDSSPTFNDNLTDISGYTHRNTLPMGKMRPEVWERQKEYARRIMTPCFLELVEKTTLPFVSTIRDCASPQASFLAGKVLLVGEALTLLRPHTGMSVTHAVQNCRTLKKVMEGHLTIKGWEREVLEFRDWHRSASVAIGSFCLCGVWSATFVRSVFRFGWLAIRQRVIQLWRRR